MAPPAQVGDHPLGRRMRHAVGECGCRCVHDVNAVLDRQQDDIGRKPGVAVGVYLQRPLAEGLLKGRDQGRYALRHEQAARILQEYRINTVSDQFLDLACVVLVGVHRTKGIN